MAYFKVNNSKNGDGTYTLSYGKGKKKLTATMSKTDAGWDVSPGDPGDHAVPPCDTMKECKAAWGEWAEETYETGGKTETAETPAASSPAPPSTPSGPPSFKRSAPVEHEGPGIPEPDPAFHEDDGTLTPLGVLDDVYNWMQRNKHRATDAQTGRLAHPFDRVARVLARELPDRDYTAPNQRTTSGKQEPKQQSSAGNTAAPSGPPSFRKPVSLAQLLATTGDGVQPDDDDIPF